MFILGESLQISRLKPEIVHECSFSAENDIKNVDMSIDDESTFDCDETDIKCCICSGNSAGGNELNDVSLSSSTTFRTILGEYMRIF